MRSPLLCDQCVPLLCEQCVQCVLFTGPTLPRSTSGEGQRQLSVYHRWQVPRGEEGASFPLPQVIRTFNPGLWEAEAGQYRVQGQHLAT